MEGPFARVVYVERTASTNDDAAALLGDDTALGMTIVAEEQTNGAGRKGRSWVAARGSALLFTTILPHEFRAEYLWSVPFWVGLGVANALTHSGVPVRLSWPNDVLLGDKKIAGILCTSRVFGESARVGCGVGINVYRTPDAAQRIAPPPAFCDDATTVDRNALLARILERFARNTPLLDDPETTARRWELAAGLPGQQYRLQIDGDQAAFEATAIALSRNGALVVERNGVRQEIALADARALR